MRSRPIMLVSGNVRPVLGDWPVGGAERQALKLSCALRMRGVDATIVARRSRLRFPRCEVVDDVPVRYVDSLYWLLYRKGVRRLEAVLRVGALAAYLARHRHEYEVIHIHTAATTTALAGVLAGRLLNKPTVLKITTSGKLNDIRRFRDGSRLPAAKKLAGLLRSATRVVALNEEATHELLADGFQPEQIVHIPNGVEVERIPPKPRYDVDTWPNITYIGRLHSAKGLNVLLGSLAQLSPALGWRLTLVGSGPARAALAQQTNALGLEDRVIFSGQVADVLPYLQRADIFVLPSRAEGISNSLLEAMAAGLPCVATNNAGNRRVLTSGETGLLVPVGDAESLASTLASLLEDVQLRERLGTAARRYVETRYSMAQVAEAYLALYQQLTGGPSQVSDGLPLYDYSLSKDMPPN